QTCTPTIPLSPSHHLYLADSPPSCVLHKFELDNRSKPSIIPTTLFNTFLTATGSLFAFIFLAHRAFVFPCCRVFVSEINHNRPGLTCQAVMEITMMQDNRPVLFENQVPGSVEILQANARKTLFYTTRENQSRTSKTASSADMYACNMCMSHGRLSESRCLYYAGSMMQPKKDLVCGRTKLELVVVRITSRVAVLAQSQNYVPCISISITQLQCPRPTTRSASPRSPLSYPLIILAHIGGMPTSILDLPTELILEIIHSEDFTNATIAYFGMTCRRFHDICQVLVLERQLPVLRALASRRSLLIYKNYGSIAMKDDELNDVKEIFQASFHKIEYVLVTFTVEEIASVHGFIFHANAVGHIDIKLGSQLYMSSLAEKKDWCQTLASFIRVSSEKDMANLTITGLPHGERLGYFKPTIPIPETPSSPFIPLPITKSSSSAIKTYFSFLSPLKGRFFGLKTRSGSIGTQPNRHVAPEGERLFNFGTPLGLKSFEIHSPLPFHGACFPQTLRALNGGYLSRLSLLNTRLHMSEWSHILPLLSMPLLSEFDVGDSDIAFRDLSPFLLRHSGITHLDLSCSSPIGSIVPPAGFLPRLEVISGNPNYLSGLLSIQGHFPNLRSVALTRHPLRAIQHGALDNILRNLGERERGTIRLSIEFSNPTGLTKWFSKAEPFSLDCVKTLEIIRFGFLISSEMCDSFFSWVSVFPYVQDLDLTQLVPGDPKMWTWRLDALWDSCPELQSIIVKRKTYRRPVKSVE
ncbi:uncharacterized protein LACBIDRAFT_327754, partial [Laccaria bicolor S238N-H82]